MSNRFIDNVYVLKFLKILTRPWKEQPAFKMGVIDKDGNVVVPSNKQSPEQRQSYSKFDVLVWNIKKLIEKVPLGKTTIAKYIAALKLLKEEVNEEDYSEISESFYKYIQDNNIFEDGEGAGAPASGSAPAPTNTTGGIDIADKELSFGTQKRKKKKKNGIT